MEAIFSDKVTPKRFIHFVWPSVLMMVIIGLYYNMDSIFVVNLVGEDALAGLSIAYPVQGLVGICCHAGSRIKRNSGYKDGRR